MVSQKAPDSPRSLRSSLSAAATLTDLVEVVLTDAPRTVGADGCILALPNGMGRQIEIVHSAKHGSRFGEQIDEEPLLLGSASPLTEAIRHGRPVVFEADGRDIEASTSPKAQPPEVGDFATFVAFPLDANVGIAGGIGFGWDRCRVLTSDEMDRAANVAESVGFALEQAGYRDREHRLVEMLHDELLTPRGTGPSFEALGAYRSPWTGVPLGGDWYDWFTFDSGETVFVIGDVSGHGVLASPTMLSIRSYLRAFAFQDPDPVSCLERLDRLLKMFAVDDGMAAVLIATFDPHRGAMTLVNGGLPAPLHRGSDGKVAPLREGREPLVGSGMDRQRDAGTVIDVAPGDTIVFYTDGLLLPMAEHRAEALALAAVEQHGGGPLQSLLDALFRLSEHGDLRIDDATVLAVRMR